MPCCSVDRAAAFATTNVPDDLWSLLDAVLLG
jgi:hypothetical protein